MALDPSGRYVLVDRFAFVSHWLRAGTLFAMTSELKFVEIGHEEHCHDKTR